jgi:hypothetical protein
MDKRYLLPLWGLAWISGRPELFIRWIMSVVQHLLITLVPMRTAAQNLADMEDLE